MRFRAAEGVEGRFVLSLRLGRGVRGDDWGIPVSDYDGCKRDTDLELVRDSSYRVAKSYTTYKSINTVNCPVQFRIVLVSSE